MQINTELFGLVEYEESDVVVLKDGLYAFEEETRFLIIPIEDSPYKVLQSLTTEDLAFTIITPFAFHGHYDFEIPDRVVEQLGIEQLELLDVYSLVVFKEPIVDSTMNLKAPLLINTNTRQGKQIILNEEYPMRFEFLKSEGE